MFLDVLMSIRSKNVCKSKIKQHTAMVAENLF